MGFHFYFLMEKVVLLHSLGWQPGIQLNTNQAKLKAFCSNIWLVWEVWVINGTRCKKKKKSYKKVATVLRQMPLLLFLMFPPHCEKFSHAYWWTIFFSAWAAACFKALQWLRSTRFAHAATSYLTQAVFFLWAIKTQFPVLFLSSPGFRVFLNICRVGL